MTLLSGEGALDVFRRALELEREGRTIVHLELGAPDVDAPPHVVEAAVAALRAGDARYVAPQGLASCARRSPRTCARAAWPPTPTGARHAEREDRRVLRHARDGRAGERGARPDPGFPIYPSMARFAGGVPVGYALDAATRPTWTTSPARRPAHARAVPQLAQQPDRRRARRGRDGAARQLVARHDLRVVTDDIYSRLVFDGGRAPTIAAFDGARERTLLVDGFSKTYAMTGYRLGYLVAPRAWIEPLVTMAINGHTCVPPFIQRAGVAALTGPQDLVASQVAAYRVRRDLLVAGLERIPGVRCPAPAGAFYVYPDFSAPLAEHGTSSRAFARDLLETHGVAALDGAAFGARGEGRLRFSFASAQADLDAAVRRVGDAVAALGRY
jgi:aspartate/methionine/tyrosine aminotransferase